MIDIYSEKNQSKINSVELPSQGPAAADAHAWHGLRRRLLMTIFNELTKAHHPKYSEEIMNQRLL